MQTPIEWVTEWAIGLLLIVVIGFAVVGIARQVLGRQTNEYEKSVRHLNRPSMRRAIMRIAEALAIIQVFLLTVGGAIGGGIYSGIMASVTGQNLQSAQVIGALFGGSAGFLSAMFLTGLLFTLAAIERNTRTTAAMLAIVARPRSVEKAPPD